VAEVAPLTGRTSTAAAGWSAWSTRSPPSRRFATTALQREKRSEWSAGRWRDQDEDLPKGFEARRAEHYASLRRPLDPRGVRRRDDDQARVLLAALATGQAGAWAGLRAQPDWPTDAETTLKQAGLIYGTNGPHHVQLGDDVQFSLRYSDDDHIARELGEPSPPAWAATHPAPAAGPDPEARE
jgi:hypothetical protein